MRAHGASVPIRQMSCFLYRRLTFSSVLPALVALVSVTNDQPQQENMEEIGHLIIIIQKCHVYRL